MGTHWGLDTRGDARQFSALIGYVAEKASQLSREKKKQKSHVNHISIKMTALNIKEPKQHGFVVY